MSELVKHGCCHCYQSSSFRSVDYLRLTSIDFQTKRNKRLLSIFYSFLFSRLRQSDSLLSMSLSRVAATHARYATMHRNHLAYTHFPSTAVVRQCRIRTVLCVVVSNRLHSTFMMWTMTLAIDTGRPCALRLKCSTRSSMLFR